MMMSLVPKNFPGGMERLRDNINDAFDRVLGRWRGDVPAEEDVHWPALWSAFEGPAIDVEEDEKNVRVTAELPGLEKDDFNVEISGNHLVIRGEKQKKHEKKERNTFYSECHYGSFTRSVSLPCEVDADNIDAKYKNGVLEITLQKTTPAKRIDVKVS